MKPKRSKSFAGCATCRQRKVRCDLTRPRCKNCRRSNLECPGFDINLIWLASARFATDGTPVGSSVVFKNTNKQDDDEEKRSVHRSVVGFVDWENELNFKPYLTYEDIDRDLLILHGSGDDRMVYSEGKTKSLGPFGVFTGCKGAKTPAKDRKKPDLKPPPPDPPKIADDDSVVVSGLQASNDYLWLSNELRDDALLTAAALNGDSQLLDFMNNLSSGRNSVLNSNANSYTQLNSLNQTGQNDFLNLLFHKNHNPGPISRNPPSSAHTSPSSNLAPTEPEINTLVDPTNQHLYYSNYNNYFYDNPYKLNENLEIHLHASTQPSGLGQDSTDLVEGQQQHVTKMPSSIMSIQQSPLEHKLGFNLHTPASMVGLPTTALSIEPLTRYLLNYYVTQVADLMTVLPLTESPWKTIYFPRALMAIGELGALGKTSTAKNALLNALLAVSAFNLQSKFPKNSESMKFYLNLGIRLRNQASVFIRKLLDSSSDTQQGIETCLKNEKYKDVLCAVMSMISVDLVWGTMQDTNFYIKWCGRVIATKMRTKKKLSPKARILHRIFSSLKIIQDSTCLNIENIRVDFQSIDEKGYDVNGEHFLPEHKDNSKKNEINYIVNDEEKANNPTPLFINKKLINTKSHNENFATDALYGLPTSLITLFSETVQLLRRKIYYEHQDSNPENFEADVQKLHDKLSCWTLDWKLYVVVKDDKNFYSPMHEVTYHHIVSFYNALTIYFDRLIRNISPEQFQDRVENTLDHLNAIQKLIVKDDVGIIPLFWQGFIAGCDAISPELQSGYKKWGVDIAQYLGSYWGARQIMLEVWRRRRLKLAKDDWVGVVGDWEMNLMLN